MPASLTGFYQRAWKHLPPPWSRPFRRETLRPSTVFEMALIALSEQQISLNAAMDPFPPDPGPGQKVLVEGKYHAFPTPDPGPAHGQGFTEALFFNPQSRISH
jgi:hypothetical protein